MAKKTPKRDEAYKKAKEKGRGKKYLEKHPKYADVLKNRKDKKSKKKGTPYKPTDEDLSTQREMRWRRKKDERHAEKESQKFYSEGALGRLDTSKYGDIGALQYDPSSINAAVTAAAKQVNASQAQDPYVRAALDRMQASLGGYTAPENRALFETMNRQLDQEAATQQRALGISQGQAGVSGDSAAAQKLKIMKQQALSRRMNQQDVLAKNVEEQRLRQAQFGQTAISAKSAQDQARDAALGRLTEAATSRSGLNLQAAGLNQANERANQETRIGLDTYNLQQGEKELAGRVGVYYGDQAATEARRAAIEARKRAEEELDIAREGVE